MEDAAMVSLPSDNPSPHGQEHQALTATPEQPCVHVSRGQGLAHSGVCKTRVSTGTRTHTRARALAPLHGMRHLSWRAFGEARFTPQRPPLEPDI